MSSFSNQIVQMFLISAWGKLLLIAFFFLLAWVAHRLADPLARRILAWRFFTAGRRRWREERLKTLRGLLSSTATFVAFLIATLASLVLFVDPDTIVWMVGLFSAAFGLGARPLIADYLTGIGFIFEDTVDVGEKLELAVPGATIEGVVEAINLRTTVLRAPSGEMLLVPNGEIRVIRNYSRGRYSTIRVNLKVPGQQLDQAISVLEETGRDAVNLLPNLLEPWEVLGVDDEDKVGPKTGLKVIAKARFGQGAKMRPRLLALVQKRLAEADVELVE